MRPTSRPHHTTPHPKHPQTLSNLPSPLPDKSNTLLSTLLPATGIPGANLLALARDGSTIYESSFGVREKGALERGEMTGDTVGLPASDPSRALTTAPSCLRVAVGLMWAVGYGYERRFSGSRHARKSSPRSVRLNV